MRWIALFSLLLVSFGQIACQKTDKEKPVKSIEKPGFPKQRDVEIREQDGLTYLKGGTEPYTGVVVDRSKEWQMKYFANYEKGKLHGAEMRWHEGGGMRKMLDYAHGEKVRHREWFENGNREIDAMMKNGEAFGRHLKWFEDGSLRFSGNFIENLLWDGPVKDIHKDGKVMWDAVFKRGRYVSGIYPPSEKQKLIDGGMLKEGEREPRINANKRE